MTKRILLITIASLLFFSCNDDKNGVSKLNKIDWILGYWEAPNTNGKITESWIRSSDTMYSGQGKFIDSAGTVASSEAISIVLRENKLWYIPVVSNQNDGQPIGFREASFTDTMVVFENMGHDFPNRIVYIKKGNDKMLAYIEGQVEGGETRRVEFPYTKQ